MRSLEVHNSELEYISEELLSHQDLQHMPFSRCRFTNVANLKQLKSYKNLVRLTLENCNLEFFPDVLSQLYILESLDVSGHCYVTSLPNSVQKLRNLETLDMSNCGLQEVFPVLSQLQSLKVLNIAGNKIQSFGELIALV